MVDEVGIPAGYYDVDACNLNEFNALIGQTTSQKDVPNAVSVEKNIPIYDVGSLKGALDNAKDKREILSEWAKVLGVGAGVVVLKNAITDMEALDKATEIYNEIIAIEKQQNGGGADHFAASGANDRIWNSLQKLCEHSPETFLRYFANVAVASVCEAWLGPNYQMTAQVNLVHPGGAAQSVHRDYHLGFQSAEICATYPIHVHDVSPILTLQGGIAHCDVPVESGPTKLLPFSQAYREGYMAWRREDFRDVFENKFVQLPLSKGDALFFNPALFHAAGANTSENIHRMVNLLQVSSAFGRATEAIDRTKMCKLVYPHFVEAKQKGDLSDGELFAAIGATAEGYSFPTNLDKDPPLRGLAPETQAAFFKRALEEGLSADQFNDHLDKMEAQKTA